MRYKTDSISDDGPSASGPSTAPLVFENAGRVFRPDTCERLKEASRNGRISLAGWARGSYPGRSMPRHVLPGVRSIGVWSANREQDWSLGEHCNEGLELTFCLRGALDIAVEGARQRLGANEVMVTAPWRPHEIGIPTVTSSLLVWFIIDLEVRRPNQTWSWPDWVLLSPEERGRIAQVAQNSDQAVWSAPGLTPAFEAIKHLVETGDAEADDTLMRIHLNVILLQFTNLLASTGATEVVRRDRTTETVRLFIDRLDEHLSYSWNINDMSKQCGVSRDVFFQKCRDVTNCTPHVYLLQRRLQEAARLLRGDHDASLTDIAMLCGFSSSAHFSSTFRKEFGMSPSEYRSNATVALPVNLRRSSLGNISYP